METKTYKTIDREALEWPSGEWDDEPDKMQWQDQDTGLPCIAVRHSHSGHWCGYVGVTDGHPWFGVTYSDIEPYPKVHGGLTFTDMCQPGDTEETGICHVPGEGEPDHVWWLGFDCHHSGDSSPLDEKYAETRGGVFARMDGYETYKDLRYVRAECARLAKQIAKANENHPPQNPELPRHPSG